ncbi:Lrp/AsnC family transcriptional regulator [Candidatus Bathyarchaeota archaeon]|nr:MAG: Lrp/AsnC family transcriptional regulator [Candidatus Bathyarchaeota archaeon]
MRMVRSYTLVRVKPLKDREIYRRIKEFPEVKEVVMTYGEYDLVVEVEVGSLDELDSFIFDKLRVIEGVEATTTLIEANPPRFEGEDR